MNNIKIKVAKEAGFCFGVERAVSLMEKTLEKNQEPVYCWGDLIHNPSVMKQLEGKGLRIIKDLRDFQENSVFVVKSHGIALADLDFVKKKTTKIVNTTCPFVIKAQHCAKEFKKRGLKVVIIGDREHVEVKGIKSRANDNAFVVSSLAELEEIKNKLTGKIGVICQTTQKKSKLEEIVKALEKLGFELEIKNTICSNTTKKQQEVKNLSSEIDLLIVIGGLHSSNTTKLAEIGRTKEIKTYHIEKASDISQEWFLDKTKVFLTAGASTPSNEIIEAKKIIKNFDF